MSSEPDTLPKEFEWTPDYEDVLKNIAETDTFDIEWDELRNIIKCKIDQNIAMFLGNPSPLSPPQTLVPVQLASGGLRLPPFPPRQENNINMIEAPKSYMTEGEAKVMRGYIYGQLDSFDSNPPFTLQRVCELCIDPRRCYKSVGKYLRAVEKSMLVTSTWDTFPPLTEQEKDASIRSVLSMGAESDSVPNTPLFSPIPFLHNDARRSKSRSPPPSPLALSSAGPVSGGHPEALEPQMLGLVDELDDPSPGHMSEHPTALTVVTTLEDGKEGGPIVQSLESRFVKAEEDDSAMAVDENKENQNA